MAKLYKNFNVCFVLIVAFVHINEAARAVMKPVHERLSETSALGGNPLVADTQKELDRRAQIHIANQQRRFNSEKDRKQKAMMERSQTQGSETMDSYMKAYRDQQDIYQREIEKKQNKDERSSKDAKEVATNRDFNGRPNSQWWKNSRQVRYKRVNNDMMNSQSNRIRNNVRNSRLVATGTKNHPYVLSPSYAFMPVVAQEHLGDFTPLFDYSSLNHQNHASAVPQYVPTQRFKTEEVNALTKAALYNSYVHGDFNQLASYKGNADVESLSALIGKEPGDQLRGFNALLKPMVPNHKVTSEDLKNAQINIKASLLDVKGGEDTKKYEYESPYALAQSTQQEHQYGYSYPEYSQIVVPAKDYTPITENVQDVPDLTNPHHHGAVKYVYATEAPAVHKTTNYYKVEVASSHEEPSKAGLNYINSYSSESDNLHYASQYEFGYRVRDHHSGNDFGHQEVSDGKSAKGSYHVLLPDGRVQKVNYVAGPSGYHAQISYQ